MTVDTAAATVDATASATSSVDAGYAVSLMREVGKVLSDKQVAILHERFGDDVEAAGELYRSLTGTDGSSDNEDGSGDEKDVDDKYLEESKEDIAYRDEFWDKNKREWRMEKKTASKKKKFGASILVVRQRFDEHMMPTETLVDVRGVKLAAILRGIFKDAEGTDVASEKLTLSPDHFFYAKEHLQLGRDYASAHGDTDAVSEIDVAFKFIDQYWPGNTVEDMIKNGVISFSNIWAIFPPNVLVVGRRLTNNLRVYRVKNHVFYKNCRGEIFRRLNSVYNDFDGSTVGTARDALLIPIFEGTLRIDSLPFVPLHMHPRRDEIWDTLIARTKRQFDYFSREGQVVEHEGVGVITYRDQEGDWVNPHKFTFTGRIMVDPLHMTKVEPDMLIPDLAVLNASEDVQVSRSSPGGKVLGIERIMESLAESPTLAKLAGGVQETATSLWNKTRDESVWDDNNGTRRGGSSLESTVNVTYDVLTDDQRILFSGLLYGYGLADSKWGAFSVDHIERVRWNQGAFKDLVMENDLKELICSLIKSQHQASLETDDIVRGKGKGLIGLLFGKPGLGKTLTAEAIAEMAETPLFMISSGTLGHTADKISTNLSKLLDLAAHWRAVLLLDEADVFLNCRQDTDLERNAIVSVFLRQLEYYQGILLMTTNRAETMDPAFQSRIHFCYQYPDLDRIARRRIWKTFAARTEASGVLKVALSEEDFDELAEIDNNGRQIKNIHSVAAKLAAVAEDKTLTKSGILKTIRVLQNFMPTRQP